ncbi:MAG: ABC transporter substrate-binding protein [Nitrosomonas sp.]|nr:ABC transporter substrate-binding protein [Nitrosomonas sp.]
MTFLFVLPAWATNIPPDRLVDETVRDVVTIINQDEELKTGRNKEKMLNLVENKILPHFDFLRMTQLAMGKNWRNANAEQQNVLVEEFRTLLVRTYSNTLSSYSDETINVSPISGLGDATEATVRTQVVQGMGKEPVPIDYSMQKTATGWKIFDVTVAGVSLVTNYRSSFNSQIRRGGVDGLIKTLSDKNISLVGK